MKNKIINYFFEEDENDLVEDYKRLIKIAVVSITIGLIILL